MEHQGLHMSGEHVPGAQPYVPPMSYPGMMPTNSHRFVINSNKNITNYIPKREFHLQALECLDKFISQLRDVCGPFSRYSLLINIDTKQTGDARGSVYDARAYIKDGRYLLEYSEYLSPIENYLKLIILYIGRCIDNVCHDGTTTSMLFSCYLLQNLIKYISNNPQFTSTSTIELDRTFKQAFENIKKKLKEDAINLDYLVSLGYDKKTAATLLTYTQALCSSGGDTEIARELSKFFRDMPECAWTDSIVNRIPALENKDKKISAEVSAYEFSIKAQCHTVLKKNYQNGNFYKNEDIDLLVIPQPLPDADVTTFDIYKYLDSELDSLLVLMIPNVGVGNTVISTIMEKSNTRGIQVIIMTYGIYRNVETSEYWKVRAISAKGNVPEYMSEDGLEIGKCIIHHASVFIDNNSIKLDKITPSDDREHPSNSHPGLTYPDSYPYYTSFKDKLDKEIEFFSKKHVKNDEVMGVLKEVVTSTHVVHPVTMKLGGLTHEMQALIPVLEDCSGAAMSVIENGAHLNGMFRFAKATWSLFDKRYGNEYFPGITSKPDGSSGLLENTIYKCVLDAATETCTDIFGPYNENPPRITEVYLSMFKGCNTYLDITKSISSTFNIDKFFKHLVDSDFEVEDVTVPPIQPANFIDELLDRVRETLIRLSYTNSIVIPGGAWEHRYRSRLNILTITTYTKVL